ncbi:MAG: hypothetical protein H6733_08675 [Alphaproteobacteria bacterium]|nr:hypothetical protein [Alphaproteobacteria bacterium]
MIARPVVVPVGLGCCPGPQRCILCPPPPVVDAAWVDALVTSYRQRHGGPVQVRFFGGAPPTDALLEPVRGLPIGVRVRPDLLTRADASRLRQAGVTTVELDALSFHNDVLKAAGRGYRRALLEQMSTELRDQGFTVGGVLAPGLPGSTYDGALDDARTAARLWSFARLHPVQVLDGSALRELLETRRYAPLQLGEAITVCRAMLDVLEPAGVEVVRVGLQAGPDGFGRAVAGPRHPGLRELVEARRVLDRLRDALDGAPRGAVVTVGCAPADETRTRGMYNQNVRTLRAELGLKELHVRPDPDVERGAFRVHLGQEPP